MTGLILKDALVLKKSLKSYLLLLAVYAVLTVPGLFSISFVAAFLEVIAMMLPMSAFAFDEQAHWDRYAAALPLSQCKLAQEVFIDFAEDIQFHIGRNVLEVLQELCQYERVIFAVYTVINIFRKGIFQFSSIFLNRFHGFLNLFSKVFAFGQLQQPIISGFFRQIETTFFDSDFMNRALHTSTLYSVKLCLDLRLKLAIFYICKSQENQAENRFGLFGGLQTRISTQLVGGRP